MALSEKHRSSIYQKWSQSLGEEEAQALLSQFPARDLDEPVTREFVRAEIADVRVEIAELRAELHEGLAGVRAEMHAGFIDMGERMRHQTLWMAGALVTAMTVLATLPSAFG